MKQQRAYVLAGLVLTMLIVSGQLCGDESAKEPRKAELRKDMTLAEVQKLHPDMRHDVWLCAFSIKGGVRVIAVGVRGHKGQAQAVDLFCVPLGSSIEKMQRENIAAIKDGVSKEEVRRVLGEPTKTGSMGGGDNKVEFLYYGDWLLRFEGGILTRERNKPSIETPSEESKTELAVKNSLLILEDLQKAGFAAVVKASAPTSQLGEVWRTPERIFLFWSGKLSRWGEPGKNLLDELNGLNLKVKALYVPEPIPVTFVAVIPPSTADQREAIRGGKVQIGMSRLAVRASWGPPRDVNRTVLKGRVFQEQWVYGGIDGQYLYFDEDGQLEAWQD